MRHLLILSLTFLSLACLPYSDHSDGIRGYPLFANKKAWANSKVKSLPDSLTKITGDFNGDGKKDLAKVIPPRTDQFGQCEKCIAKISFSNGVKTLTIPYEANGAIIYNVGDLDGNKTDELLVVPDSPNSCIGTQWVYTYRRNLWDTVASGEVYRCLPGNTIKKIKNGSFQMLQYIDGQDSIIFMTIK